MRIEAMTVICSTLGFISLLAAAPPVDMDLAATEVSQCYGKAHPEVREFVRQWLDCNLMKQLLSSPDSAEIGLARSRLEAAGIECELRNEYLSPAMPGAPFASELWVLRDSQFAEASELVAAWRAAASSEPKPD